MKYSRYSLNVIKFLTSSSGGLLPLKTVILLKTTAINNKQHLPGQLDWKSYHKTNILQILQGNLYREKLKRKKRGENQINEAIDFLIVRVPKITYRQ